MKVRVWHICYRLPLSLSKLLEFRLFLLGELPDCWKRNSLVFKRTNRHSVFVTSMVRHFVTHCLSQPSVSFKIMVKWLNQQALIYGESCKCRVQFLNNWHFHFNFSFRIHFFFNFYLLKKNSTSCKKTCRSYFNQKWFWILYNEFFLQTFYFVVLFSHTGFNQLMSQGLFCKEPVVRHLC